MFYHQGALVATKRREEVEAARKTSAKSAEAPKSSVLDQVSRLFMAGQPNPPPKVSDQDLLTIGFPYFCGGGRTLGGGLVDFTFQVLTGRVGIFASPPG